MLPHICAILLLESSLALEAQSGLRRCRVLHEMMVEKNER
jgi:hypothetical protein